MAKKHQGLKGPAHKVYAPEEGKFGFVDAKKGTLTPRQKTFVAEYILDFNPTRAYTAAGYSGKNTAAKAYRVLSLPQVQEELKIQLKRRQQDKKVTADKVIEELAKVALVDVREFFNDDGTFKHPKEMNETIAAAVSSIDLYAKGCTGTPEEGIARFPSMVKKLHRWDKMKALELLGRYLGLDKVKFELTGANGEPLAPPVFQINFIPTTEPMRGTSFDPCPPIRE